MDLRLQVRNKSLNIKTLKGTRTEYLSDPKFVEPMAIINFNKKWI